MENIPNIPIELKDTMSKQGYHFVGNHSAVKICEYTANALRDEGLCYKHAFYGIKSWQCIQSTTALGCDLACRFCWRFIPEELGYEWNELNVQEWDDPKEIVEGMIKEQRKIVSGFKAIADTDKKLKRWKEANEPRHVAISLTGESLFYPKMSALLNEFHKRGISTFIVHNGTLPESIAKLNPLPTQFYISLQAPDENTYNIVTRPKIQNSWQRFIKSIKMLKTLKTRTVLRMTLVKELNMFNPEGYANIIKMGMPNYVEVKGFSFVGSSRDPQRNLTLQSMPNHNEIKEFADKLAELTEYIVTAEHQQSRNVLLSRDEDSKKNRMIDFSKVK
ncbi:MAG: 4-demethylwyosine synthase TYW1 [Candidatus Marsarchaeota archaeon]|nr:4-demethylwyosine synthase TYW1 [Candidatus Marsarchaeota archaeon]